MTLSYSAAAFACLIACGTAASQSAPGADAHRVTVIGCIARSQLDVAATSGTTVLDQDQTRYILVNVTLPADGQRSATADVVAASVPMYRLDDSRDPAIAPHVGEKVEVTGTVQPPARSRPDRQPPPRAAAAPLLKIEKLQAVGAATESCRAK
jgi:hypothetical protein